MSIANYLTALDAQRDQLARNLVTMGVQASESEKLNTLVPKVLQIVRADVSIKMLKKRIMELDIDNRELRKQLTDMERKMKR